MTPSKREYVGVGKGRAWHGENFLGFLDGTSRITRVLTRGRQESQIKGGDVTLATEVRVVQGCELRVAESLYLAAGKAASRDQSCVVPHVQKGK